VGRTFRLFLKEAKDRPYYSSKNPDFYGYLCLNWLTIACSRFESPVAESFQSFLVRIFFAGATIVGSCTLFLFLLPAGRRRYFTTPSRGELAVA
jgi:hypothetical protein